MRFHAFARHHAGHGEHHADGHACEQERGSPVTHQGQRLAGGGEQPDGHAHVDEGLHGDGQPKSEHQIPGEQRIAADRRLGGPEQQGEIEQDQPESPHRAPLLHDEGVDHVGIGVGQEVSGGARRRPRRQDAAFVDGDLGQFNLIVFRAGLATAFA